MKVVPIPRKLLVVKRDPPDNGYNIMLEIGERTHSYQVPDNIGIEIINACQDKMLEVLVQRGFKVEVKIKKNSRRVEMSLDDKLAMNMFEKIKNNPHLVGLSLSRCIRDVIQNKVSVEQVDRIIARTMCETPEHWNQVIELYKGVYWEYDPERAERITREFIKLGLIIQPRVIDKEYYSRNYHELIVNRGEHWSINTKTGGFDVKS